MEATGLQPCPALLFSSPDRRHQLQAFILGTGKALPSLLRAAHEQRSPPSQLLPLPQFLQRLMLWAKGNCSQSVPLLSLPFQISTELLCKRHPKARLREQLKGTEVKGRSRAGWGPFPEGPPPLTPLLLSLRSTEPPAPPQISEKPHSHHRNSFYTSPFGGTPIAVGFYNAGRK